MIWWFHGESFSLDIDRDGERTFMLNIAWHQPNPDMGGREPELSLDEIEALLARPMRVRLCSGGADKIIGRAQNYALVGAGISFGELQYEPRCMVTTFPDGPPQIEVTAALDTESFVAVSEALFAYAASTYPKCYGGSLQGPLILGPQQRRPSAEEMQTFLCGERPAMVEEAPRLALGFGTPLPKAPDFSQVLKDLQRQFE